MKTGRGTVPVEPLREAFERSGMTAGDVARILEWHHYRARRGRTADSTRVRRTLGVVPTPIGAGLSRTREHVDHATAMRLMRAIGCAPVDVGL